MKTFLEHTKNPQEEGMGDTLKKGASAVGGAVKKVATGGGKGPGVMDRVKQGAKKVVQAVGREFQKGKDQAKAQREKKPGVNTMGEVEPTDNKVDATGDAFVKKDKDAEIKKKKDEEKEEEQRKLEAGYAPLPVDQR